MNFTKGQFDARIKELTAKADNKDLSNSVRYKSRRDADILTFIVGNVPVEHALNDADSATLDRLMDPEVFETITVSEGDSIMKLLEENQDRRDVMGKLSKAAEKAGLKLDFASGKVVKA